MPWVYVALGSNIQPETHLRQAVAALQTLGRDLRRSHVYQTAPQGYSDQDDFLNMAICLWTDLDLETFKMRLTDLETSLGRVRDPQNKNAPRTIDLDIALWGEEIRTYGAKPWHVPDPDIGRYAHLALPLANLAPDFIHPELGETLAALASRFDMSALQLRNDVFTD